MGIAAGPYIEASGLPPAGDQANAVLTGTLPGLGPSPCFAFRGPMNVTLWANVNTALTTTAGSLTASVGSAAGLAAGNSINSANVPAGSTVGVLSGTTVTIAVPPIAMPGTVAAGVAAISNLPSTTGLVGATVTGPGIPAGTTVTSIATAAIAATNLSPGKPGAVRLSNPVSSSPTVTPVPAQQFTFARNGNAIVTTGADAAASFTGGLITFGGTVQLERSFDGGATFLVCNIGAGGALAQWATPGPVNFTFGEPEKQVLYRFNCIVYSSGTLNYRISQTGGAAESLAIGPLSGG